MAARWDVLVSYPSSALWVARIPWKSALEFLLQQQRYDRLATTEIFLNLTESQVIEEFQNEW